MSIRKWSRSEVITYVLLTLVYVASWIDINGIFAELPQIVLTQPEGWRLGAHLGLAANFGNIAPLVLVLIKCFVKRKTLDPVPINYVVILIGMLACFLLIFFWSYTTIIGNERRSTALLILTFLLSILDCSSSVSFADYANRFRKEFLGSFFLGECLTSLLPSVLALAQGNGEIYCQTIGNETVSIYQTARFPVSIYFLCLFLLLTISFTAFTTLQWTRIAHKAIQVTPETSSDVEIRELHSKSERMSKSVYLLMLIGCLYTSSILYGLMISISTYVLMPYGQRIFYWGTVISPWMMAIVWFLGSKQPLIKKPFLIILIAIGSILMSYVLYVAATSPCSPLVGSTAGSAIILTIWFLTYIAFGYPRLVIANYVRSHSSNGMFWFGVNIQCGALLGTVTAYLLVEVFGVFHEQAACEPILC